MLYFCKLIKSQTMKTLYIVRHAKSSWDFPGLADHERPLMEKGKKRTRKIIEYLREKQVVPDLIVSSSALRARETANYIASGLGIEKDEIKIDSGLYHADADSIFNQFEDLSESYQSVMLVGHNPALTNFVNIFLSPPIDWLPTSAVVAVDFHTSDWEDLKSATYSIRMVVFPKLLGTDK